LTDLVNKVEVLEVPRGDLGASPLQLKMAPLYEAELRISETRVSNPATAAELMAVFNEACHTSTKYISWIKYEILRAKRNYELAKATVLIDKLPDEVAKLKEVGIKDNADFRAALVNRDKECRTYKDFLDVLEATKTFIEAKLKTFERSYWDSKENGKRLLSDPAMPNTSIQAGSQGFTPPSRSDQLTAPTQEPQPAKNTFSFIGTSKF